MLEATAIQLRRGNATLLDGVSLAVSPGEIVGVIGPNGAGKSTLLRLLAGLDQPNRGQVTLDGTSLSALSRNARARRIAYLPQAGHAEWAVSVRQLVTLGRLPHGEAGLAADREAVDRALAEMDIAALAERSVTTLSGGELARALLARALAVEADYLLADEPTLSLDPRHQLGLMTRLGAIAATGAGIVVVLHDLALAARFCHRLLVLNRGRAVAAGPPELTLTPQILAGAYGIEALIGRHDEQPYVVPWREVL
jgi:iron complex transport system ATP-binding protein